MKKILITGANGFIGSNLINKIDKKKYNVIALSNQKTIDSSFESINCDILDYDSLSEKVKDVDIVIHLAAINKTNESIVENRKMLDTNAMGTFNVMNLAKERNAEVVIYASSAAVYGMQEKFPIKEDFNLNPSSLYGLSKLIGEQICKLIFTKSNKIFILRFGNVYGPRQGLGFVIPDMFSRALKGDFEVKYSDSTRDFIYVDDATDAIQKCFSSSSQGTYNISSGVEISIEKIAEIIGKLSKRNFKSFKADINRMWLDIKEAEKKLDWKPRITIEEGLKKSFYYFSKEFS